MRPTETRILTWKWDVPPCQMVVQVRLESGGRYVLEIMDWTSQTLLVLEDRAPIEALVKMLQSAEREMPWAPKTEAPR